MKFVTFDIEIAEEIPEGADYSNQPISVAATAKQGCVGYHEGIPSMDQSGARKLVETLEDYCRDGYSIVSWNGLSFDFRVLALQSGWIDRCAKLALEHIDPMVIVTFQKGYYLGLNTACVGMGLAGKKHEVYLKDGTLHTDMGGAQAPELWKSGEYEAVKAYLHDDVVQLLMLVEKIQEQHCLRWTSKSGRLQYISIPRLLSCAECFAYPVPDTSWMTNPPTRQGFVKWIPEHIVREYTQ